MKHHLWSLACFACLFLLPAPAIAGGVFGDGGVVSGSVEDLYKKVGPSPDFELKDPSTDSFNTILKAKPKTRGLTIQSLDELESAKTSAQRTLEQKAQETLGVPVSNICLTATQACIVSYSTAGSTCFCESSDGIDLGFVN
jgi:hypothetical protein